MTFKLSGHKTLAGKMSGNFNFRFKCQVPEQNPNDPICPDCMQTIYSCSATDAGEGVGYYFTIQSGGFYYHTAASFFSQVVYPDAKPVIIDDSFICRGEEKQQSNQSLNQASTPSNKISADDSGKSEVRSEKVANTNVGQGDCELKYVKICPTGYQDGCLLKDSNNQSLTLSHVCVPDNEVEGMACELQVAKLCSADKEQDACLFNGYAVAKTHLCVLKEVK